MISRRPRPAFALLAILALAAVERLHNLHEPLADNLQAKQVYVANKARSIAREPFDPLRNTLDFLDQDGRRIVLTEEVPLYTGLLAAGYRAFGERPAVGHLLSLLGSLAAIAAFYDLARREGASRTGTEVAPPGRVLRWRYRFRLIRWRKNPAPSPLAGEGARGEPAPLVGGGAETESATLAAEGRSGGSDAAVATLVFASCPLFLFYGRAVLPDPWMLAGMLACASAHRRSLEADAEGRRRAALGWLAAATLAGALAAAFKYFSLMILIPLADQVLRAGRAGVRRWVRFGMMAALIVAPTAAWMGLVFATTPNPVGSGWSGEGEARPYLVAQDPGVLADRRLYDVLTSRFLLRDCGPVAAVLIGLGAASTIARRRRDRREARIGDRPPDGLAAWTLMGLSFFLGLGPKLIDHDYYELMMLPAAALWASRGWRALAGAGARARDRSRLRRVLAVAALIALVAVQSPWVLGGLFRQEPGKLALADALRRAVPDGGRVVVIGPGIALVTVVHHAGVEGWSIRGEALPPDWGDRLARFRGLGAKAVGVYFDPSSSADQRATYRPLLEALPVVEQRSVPARIRGRSAEIIVLRLDESDASRLASDPRLIRRR